MSPERLRELVAGGETLRVEFKGEDRARLRDDDLVEAVVCMANQTGTDTGYVLIGVEDDGRVTGAKPRHEAGITDPRRVQALIANRTRPSLAVGVEEVPYDNLPILVIAVTPAQHAVSTSEAKYIRRAIGSDGKPACVPFFFHEAQSFQASRGVTDYSSFVVPGATWQDLDPLEFERFRRTIRESKGLGDTSLLDLSDRDMAMALGAVERRGEDGAVRVLGLLLFGKESILRSAVPTHEVAFQAVTKLKVEVNDFMRWPLLRVMEELMSRFRGRYREEELMVGMFRVGVPDFSEKAYREGIANALIHRDYTQLGAVHVQWYEDRIEISNPGGFPEGVSVDNLLVTAPRPRNPLLADAFKRAGVVERTGRGIDTIFYEQLRNGRPAPAYGNSTQNTVTLQLPGGLANIEFVRLVSEENQADRPLSLDALLVLNHLLAHRRLTSAEAAALIQKSDSDARSVLERLVDVGLIEGRGERRARTYHFSAPVYRRMDGVTGYVRQHGFESIQQEHMIIQAAKKAGFVTRSQVAELCKVSERQASYLLAKMRKEGKLQMKGTRRGATYTLAPDASQS